MRVVRSINPLLLAVIAGLLGATRLEAQSCLAQPLVNGEKQLAFTMDDASTPGGAIGWRGGKDGIEYVIDAAYLAPPFPEASGVLFGRLAMGGNLESDAKQQARAARPDNAKGKMPCGLFEMAGNWTGEASPVIYTLGLGYAFGNDRMSAYAAPAAGFGDKGVGFVFQAVGGAVMRSGVWFAGADMKMPLNTPNSEIGIRFKGGFVFGKAAAPKPVAPPMATPAENTVGSNAGNILGTAAQAGAPAAAATQPATTATATTTTAATTKPYSVDDITGMLSNSLSTTRILDLTRRSCINFKMTEMYETKLRRAGAEPELLEGLKKTCYTGL